MSQGGLSPEKPADQEAQKICDEVKSQAEAMAGVIYSQFEAVSYRHQVVKGTMYYIKVYVGDSFVFLKVLQSLPAYGSTIKLIAMETGKKEEDSLESF